ncbi:MAG: D-alanine--D-alanine ligase, partial [Microbacteriaceae bacterium]
MNTVIRTVAVLAGGISHERDVSLRSGRRVADSLKQQGIAVELIDPDHNLFEKLSSGAFDVVWPVLHGAAGEDGTLSDLLELMDIPSVGSLSSGARLAWDKPTAKALLSAQGIHTPEAVTISQETFRDYGA